MALYRDEAIVLRTQKLGEADRIVTLLTRQHGKVRAVAKGVRRTRSRFGARLEPFMVVDVQLYEGRSLDTVTQAETLAPVRRRRSPATTSPTPPATAMLETAERLTEEREPALQQFLLLAGGLQLAGRRRARDRAGARRLPAALARRRRLGAELPRLRALRRPGPAQGLQPRQRRHRLPVVPHRPARRRPALQTLELLAALLAGDWAVADASAHAAPPRGQRPGRRLPAVAPRARACARCGWWSGYDDTAPSRTPPGRGRRRVPADLVPRHVAIVMDGNGRWANARGLPRTKGHEAGEASLLDVVAGVHRDRRAPRVGLRVLDRELEALARRGALPHGLQPRRDPAPPRHPQRLGRPGPLGRPAAAAVAQRRSRSSRSPRR